MKHIILAGTSRSGKTMLSLELSKLGYTHYKLDSIKRGIYGNFVEEDGHKWEEVSPKIAKLIKQMLADYKTDSIYQEEYYLIDTCHLFPKDALLLKSDDCMIIFLGYTDVTLEEEMENLKLYDKNHYWSKCLLEQKELIEANIQFSYYLKEECKKYGFLYYDTGKNRQKVFDEIISMMKDQM